MLLKDADRPLVYPGPLKLSDFASLAQHLRAPTLDLTPNVVDVRHGSPLKRQFSH